MASYRYLAAAVLTLAAGAVMAVAGYLFHNDGWHVAGPSMIPAGILISIAFALAVGGQPSRRDGSTVRSGAKAVIVLVTGMPLTSGVPLVSQLLTTLLSLLAGWAMVIAGYAAAESKWWLIPPFVIVAGVVISGSFAVTLRPFPRRLPEPVADRQVLDA